ncbi:putative ferric-chelate reductase 1 [Chanos chanos]|uniref:Ferric-chelate reductase 1 n=1 Tax=Chanos chanos TaxID=29144 RepID=A0A6J2UVW6_CHACN|nr:putative ferric-chelate reductase 1 [Chanos chanos]
MTLQYLPLSVRKQLCTVVLLLACVRVAEFYPSGAVGASCGSMTPVHRSYSSQGTTAPYTVTADRDSFMNGDEITVTLRASSSAFTGFMLQARAVGGTTPVGSFSVNTADAQLLTCNGQSGSAVSHTSSSQKTTIQIKWKAPTSGNLQNIEFMGTFVRSFSVFWVGVKSAQIRYNGSSSGNSEVLSSNLVSSTGCGVSKVCFSQPSNCDPAVTTNCYFVSAIMSGSAVQYEMSGQSDGYMALGLSDDQEMGNDDIYICGKSSNGSIQVQRAHSTGTVMPDILSLGDVSDIKTSDMNGVISCSFTSRNPITTVRSTRSTPSYFIMLARGPTANGVIRIHPVTPFVTRTKVDISSPQVVTTQGLPSRVKAHGSLMLIAWMFTGSLGMLIARYMKAFHRGSGCCGKDLWFVCHLTLMIFTVIATSIGFIIAFPNGHWSGEAHDVIGCLVIILTLAQPFIAIFRCAPQHQWRFVFNWAHCFIALAVKGLAVAGIFTGLGRVDHTEDQWLVKVMGGYVGWEALLYVLLDLQKRWVDKDPSGSGVSDLKSTETILLIVYFLGNFAFLVALLVGIDSS